jgi:leucyl/phenylalanyl-tRNA--protein transferase
MPQYRFPDLKGVSPEKTPEGLVALGGDFSPENLMEAYRKGIFPWPISPPGSAESEHDELLNTWFSPSPRAILDFGRLHIPRSLKQAQKRAPYTFTLNKNFRAVMTECSQVPRPGQGGTWITEEILDAYCELHEAGFAHSVEAWEGDLLVGGLYGVNVDGAFAGESMFHLKPNASKLALLFLIEHLQSRDLAWMDIQMLTPHLVQLGAHEISRDDYLEKLAATRARGLKLF